MTQLRRIFDARTSVCRLLGTLTILSAAVLGPASVGNAGPPETIQKWRTAWEQRLQHWHREVRSWTSRQETRPLGISFVTRAAEFVPTDQVDPMPRRIVLLIHGLDEPGYIWDDLQPALLTAGYAVARFEYPNDGAIAESADRLACELERIRTLGVRHVDIVAHSMGGLVSRDLLTRPEHYGGDGCGNDRLPSIDRLIMVGTPNHGSEWARMRGVTELKERAYRFWTSGGDWGLDFDADGSGQAGEDLLPGSGFLRTLNDRPAPDHTRLSIVAGRLLPVTGAELELLRHQIERTRHSESTPQWVRDWLEHDPLGSVSSCVSGMSGGVGDGVVTVDSARWTPVEDFTIVEANHMSLLFKPGNGETPPAAIPIILDRLK